MNLEVLLPFPLRSRKSGVSKGVRAQILRDGLKPSSGRSVHELRGILTHNCVLFHFGKWEFQRFSVFYLSKIVKFFSFFNESEL
ncbi:hypothetical protein Lnau_0440 [Legionella nautarum]|uniref:Uncharacterized protein n=1 Tax=Legionella nautarum TaxID=45070 RepID=A0A0W0X296_9GAMM|nr:hypothetical protein Lnau_0440 [Legionella nautarum]